MSGFTTSGQYCTREPRPQNKVSKRNKKDSDFKEGNKTKFVNDMTVYTENPKVITNQLLETSK